MKCRLAPELSQLKYISGSEQYPRLPDPREDLGRVCPNIHLGSHTSGGCDEVLGKLTQARKFSALAGAVA